MNILLIGSGGREHALAWKLAQSPHVTRISCAPGNAGIADVAECIPVKADDIDGLLDLVEQHGYDFVVVGPEIPLALGIVDRLQARGVKVFGPTQAAAQLESSKAFTKDFCARHNIPTAGFGVFTDSRAAKSFLRTMDAPYVIKADGLAAGKGVVIPQTLSDAEAELDAFFSGKFGEAGQTLVIEDFMHGPEASFFAISDGTTAIPLIAAQDHKRAFDGDTGPNTGGMGAYSPTPVFTDADQAIVMETIINPTVAGMAKDGHPFVGVLFAGLMMTSGGPKLIEYNVRFGDPECQVLMRRLQSDLMDILRAAEAGTLSTLAPRRWSEDAVVNVVLAAKGYPGPYQKGTIIGGLDTANAMDGVTLFHAGTQSDGGQICASGGRVLNVTAQAPSLKVAIDQAYKAIDSAIDWPDGFCRRDIAYQAL